MGIRKKTAEKKSDIKEKVAESFGVAKEVVLDFPRLVFVGNRELMVENYKSIGEYTEKQILLDASRMRIRIIGSELEIKSIASELIYICGKIDAVEFKKEV